MARPVKAKVVRLSKRSLEVETNRHGFRYRYYGPKVQQFSLWDNVYVVPDPTKENTLKKITHTKPKKK